MTPPAPTLDAVLACRGDLLAIACAVWQDDAPLATPDHVYSVAEWALRQVAATGEGAVLATICATFGCTPSSYIGLTDPVLALAFDSRCLRTFSESRRDSGADSESITYSVPDPWKEGDDDQ